MKLKIWKRTKFDHESMVEIPFTHPKIRDIFDIQGARETGQVWDKEKHEGYWLFCIADSKLQETLDILKALREKGVSLEERLEDESVS